MGRRVKKAAAERELAASRRMLAMDVAGVNRFINAAMGSDLSEEQRVALRSSGGGGKDGTGGTRERGEAGEAAEEGAAAAEAQAFLAGVAANLPLAGCDAAAAHAGSGSTGNKKKKKRKNGA